MVHPLHTGYFRHTSHPKPSWHTMPSAPPPHIRMAMRIPVGRGGGNGGFDRLPRQKLAAFEGQRLQRFPPRFNQVEVGGIAGLKDELPARMRQIEEQDIIRFMHHHVVQNDIHPLYGGRNRCVHLVQKVDEVRRGAPHVGGGQRFARRRLEGPKHLPRSGTPPILQLLRRTPSRSACGWPWAHQRTSRMRTRRQWPHFVDAHHYTVGRWGRIAGVNGPLFLAKSGSTRSPNQPA